MSTTESFSAASTTTSVSQSTAEGTVTSTISTSADSNNPTPVTTFATSEKPAVFNPFAAIASPAAATATETTETAEGEVAPEEESTAEYTPVVKLEAVEVKTGEEDDEVLYTQRAALYRFDLGAGEWKERGKGDVKLLQNKDNHKVRILLRQEKTLKICMNHLVHPDLPFKPNAGSDRSWTWRVRDYAGDEPEGKDETFAIRFRDADIANAFKAKIDEVKEVNAKLLKA